jgi:hypothetical protein
LQREWQNIFPRQTSKRNHRAEAGRTLDVFKPDAGNQNVRTKNRVRGRKSNLSCQRGVLVHIRVGDDGGRDVGGLVSVARDADAADELAVFVKRHAAGRARQSAGDGQRRCDERESG